MDTPVKNVKRNPRVEEPAGADPAGEAGAAVYDVGGAVVGGHIL